MGEGNMSPDEFREAEGLDEAAGTSQEEIFAFLHGQDAKMENADSPLDRVGHQLREQIMKDWSVWEEMEKADQERLLALMPDLHGDRLHQLRIIAEDLERASKDLADAAAKFRALDIDGQQFSTELQSVLQRQKGIHARLETIAGRP